MASEKMIDKASYSTVPVGNMDIMELDTPGADRKFRVKGVATPREALDAVQDKCTGTSYGDPHLSIDGLVVGSLTSTRIDGVSDSWEVQVRYRNPCEPANEQVVVGHFTDT